MFDEMEFNPMALGLGLAGAVLSLVVMSKVEVNVIFKIGSFVATAIVCYFMANKILDSG